MSPRTTAVIASALLYALLLVAPAHAAFPGQNGKIAFSAFPIGGDSSEIYSINPDGSGLTNLTNHPATNWAPVWSPDGRKIAFYSNRDGGDFEIYVMNADGSGLQRLTSSVGFDAHPSWSPDGRKIVFASNRNGVFQIYVMAADGSGLQRITSNTAWWDTDPDWSPDGSRIAFSHYFTGTGVTTVYTMNPDGTSLSFVATGFEPDWFPAGARLAFHDNLCDADPDYCQSDVFVADLNGSGRVNLTNSGFVNDSPVSELAPALSPDGRKIVYLRYYPPEGGDLYVMNADGSGATRITTPPDTVKGDPDWQPLPGPQRSDYKNASQFCKAERDFLGEGPFRQKYGGRANAHGKCVSGK